MVKKYTVSVAEGKRYAVTVAVCSSGKDDFNLERSYK